MTPKLTKLINVNNNKTLRVCKKKKKVNYRYYNVHINVIINVRLKQQIKESYSSIVNLTSRDFKKTQFRMQKRLSRSSVGGSDKQTSCLNQNPKRGGEKHSKRT